jgi:hypothetical protein
MVFLQYGWIFFALNFYFSNTMRNWTRKGLDNMRSLIQERSVTAVDSNIKVLSQES